MTKDVMLLKPVEVDRLLRYPHGRSAKLARAGKFPHIVLPDGEIRFVGKIIERLLEAKGPPESTKSEESRHA
jgi:hypothetical protein